MRAIRIEQWGGPEVLTLVDDQPEPVPGPGEVLIEVDAAGVNFADTHAREDSYVARYELPLVPGSEVVGRVDGERVLALCGTGGYAERAVAPAAQVFPIPEGVSDGAALALLVQGLTAWHVWHTCAHLTAGESVVVHSAAGGVGQLAVQLARALGAGRVIATASSADKRDVALALGAHVAVDPAATEDLTEALLEANGGEPVDVVVEMAGGDQFDASYRALAPFGRIVVCGIASREQNTVRTGSLLRRSRSVLGFWLFHCLERPETMVAGPLADLFARTARGELRLGDGTVYPLSEARRAHEDLVARRTTGKLLLDPRR